MTTLTTGRRTSPQKKRETLAREEQITSLLLRWYRANARDLPWRRTRDPYAIWVSEVMLQQTRVDTVVPYWSRFTSRWPDARALAAARLDDVLEAWSGLGYYRRARVLHLAAREVAERWGGELPKSAERLRDIPGIGPYTAGAIASIAYGQRAPIVDANVTRVLARLDAMSERVGSGALTRKLWALAGRLLPNDHPGDFNQAMMELGALVCTPRSPRCDACPVAKLCVAREKGLVDSLPVTIKSRERPTVRMVALVAERKGKVLLARRVAAGLFGGLWEPPMVEAASLEGARLALEGIGVDVGGASLLPSGEVRHVLSHKIVEISVARLPKESPSVAMTPRSPYDRVKWLDASLAGVGVSSLTRKVLGATKAAPRRYAGAKYARAK